MSSQSKKSKYCLLRVRALHSLWLEMATNSRFLVVRSHPLVINYAGHSAAKAWKTSLEYGDPGVYDALVRELTKADGHVNHTPSTCETLIHVNGLTAVSVIQRKLIGGYDVFCHPDHAPSVRLARISGRTLRLTRHRNKVASIMDDTEIADRFQLPNLGNGDQTEAIRNKCRDLAHHLNSAMPDGREKSLALTKLEEAMLWAGAGIASK